MDPDQPEAQAPADPFQPNAHGFVAIIEVFRGYRDAGGGWLESAMLTVCQMVVYGTIAGPDGKVQ